MVGRRKRCDSPHAAAAEALAREIRRRRTARDWSQQRLAGEAGLSYGTIRAIERGAVTEPGFFTVRSIADAFGSSIDDLLSESPDAREGAPTAAGGAVATSAPGQARPDSGT